MSSGKFWDIIYSFLFKMTEIDRGHYLGPRKMFSSKKDHVPRFWPFRGLIVNVFDSFGSQGKNFVTSYLKQ